MVDAAQKDPIPNRHRSCGKAFAHFIDRKHFHSCLSHLDDRDRTIFSGTIKQITGENG